MKVVGKGGGGVGVWVVGLVGAGGGRCLQILGGGRCLQRCWAGVCRFWVVARRACAFAEAVRSYWAFRGFDLGLVPVVPSHLCSGSGAYFLYFPGCCCRFKSECGGRKFALMWGRSVGGCCVVVCGCACLCGVCVFVWVAVGGVVVGFC